LYPKWAIEELNLGPHAYQANSTGAPRRQGAEGQRVMQLKRGDNNGQQRRETGANVTNAVTTILPAREYS
jgi:hypothetical protein